MSPEEREAVAEEVAEATMALNLAAAALRRLQRLLLDEPGPQIAPEAPRPAAGPVPASQIWKQPRPPVRSSPPGPPTDESLRAAVERAMGLPGDQPITFGSGIEDDDEVEAEEPAP